jgi:hypothetical protein
MVIGNPGLPAADRPDFIFLSFLAEESALRCGSENIDIRLTREILHRVAQLKGSFDALHHGLTIPKLNLEVHALISRQINNHINDNSLKQGDMLNGVELSCSSTSESDVKHNSRKNDFNASGSNSLSLEELGLSVDNLAQEGFGSLPVQEKEKQHIKFLNALQGLVTSKWKEDVGRLTRMIYEPFPGTVKAELAFWEALRCAVEKGLDELQTPGVLLTLEILHRSNRNINM